MARDLESLKKEAEALFLRREAVIGIGFGEGETGRELVFFLKNESQKSVLLVNRWAAKYGIPVRFVITGRITTLTKA